MTKDLDELRKKRLKYIDGVRENNFEDGIKRLLTDLYPDNAHFIYELLQNSEDTHASFVRFILSDSSVEFEHNGERLFSLRDIDSITSIGTSTKRDDPTRIGKFGVGFKAVFAYTNAPEIHSGDFHFRIRDLVVPEIINVERQLVSQRKTRFVFPFDSPKKPRSKAVDEIERGLLALGDNTLLFLAYIRKIEYSLPNGSIGTLERISHEDRRIEIRAEKPNGDNTISNWMCFQKDVFIDDEEGKSKNCRIAIAYSLVKAVDKKGNSTWKIVPLDHGQVSIYFTADKETSNLRFHLHAPFASTVARDSVRDSQANDQLRDQIAKLVVESLTDIRDQGLLTVDFLAVLPNSADNLSAFYKPIRDKIIQAFNEEALTPTRDEHSHAPAKKLLQAKASLKALLSADDIKFLVKHDEEPPQWAVARALQGTKVERFMSGLAITDWDVEQFVELLQEKASIKWRPYYYIPSLNEEFKSWLSQKSLDWHQELYALLFSDCLANAGWQREYYANLLKPLWIVRLSDGCYSVGTKCFFPSDGVAHDDALPRVDKSVYTSGKSKTKQESAKKFLEEIGVRDVGEAEHVEAILKQRYAADNHKPKKGDLKRFIALFEKEPDKAKLFKDYFIFEVEDGRWWEPNRVFLDQPFMDTGLSAYYVRFGENAKCFALSDSYKDCGIDIKKLVNFAEAVGVRTHLEITLTKCEHNPDWCNKLKLVSGKKSSPVNIDYVITGLDKLLIQPSLKLSKLVWNTMESLPPYKNYLLARYQHNNTEGYTEADSQLVHQLRIFAWIPQGDGEFVVPAEALRDLLPEGFPFDYGWPWLKAIHFGHEAVKKSDVYRQKQTSAKELGFESAEEAEKWKKVRDSGISPDDILAQHTQRQRASQPEESVSNPVRRRKNVLANTENALSKDSILRERSIQIGISEVSAQAKAYLRSKYKNTDDQLVCQCCQEEMPFKLHTGEHYFEAVQCIEEKETRHYQNRLALCPTCAAKYQHACETDDNEIHRRIIELDADDQAPAVEIFVRLAGRECTLRFVGAHWFDLKTILSGNEA